MSDDKYSVQNILDYALDGKPYNVKDAVDNIMIDKIHAEVQAKKIELAKTLFGGTDQEPDEEIDYEDEDEEFDGAEDDVESEEDEDLDLSDEEIDELLKDLEDFDVDGVDDELTDQEDDIELGDDDGENA